MTKPDFSEQAQNILNKLYHDIYSLEFTDGEFELAANFIKSNLTQAYEAGRKSVLDRIPSEEDSRNERLRWAKGMYVFAPIKSDYMEQQIQTLGINPWNSCYEWLKEKLTKDEVSGE